MTPSAAGPDGLEGLLGVTLGVQTTNLTRFGPEEDPGKAGDPPSNKRQEAALILHEDFR